MNDNAKKYRETKAVKELMSKLIQTEERIEKKRIA